MFDDPFRPFGYSVFAGIVPNDFLKNTAWGGGRLYMDVAPFLNESTAQKLKMTLGEEGILVLKELMKSEKFKNHTDTISYFSIASLIYEFSGFGASAGWTHMTSGVEGLIKWYQKEFPPIVQKGHELMGYSKTTFIPLMGLEKVPFQENLTYTTGVF
eukprot:gene12078-5571_t